MSQGPPSHRVPVCHQDLARSNLGDDVRASPYHMSLGGCAAKAAGPTAAIKEESVII